MSEGRAQTDGGNASEFHGSAQETEAAKIKKVSLTRETQAAESAASTW